MPRNGPAAPATFWAVYVLATLAALFWAGAAWAGERMYRGNDMVEGLLSVLGFFFLVSFEMIALVLTICTAVELRRRNAPRAAVVATLVAVVGVAATIAYVLWLPTVASPVSS